MTSLCAALAADTKASGHPTPGRVAAANSVPEKQTCILDGRAPAAADSTFMAGGLLVSFLLRVFSG